jgi:hypothetical protein
MIIALLFLILFAILFRGALRFLFALIFIGGIVILGEVHAENNRHDIGAISCYTIINKGWANMPDVTDYVKAKPNSDILGYGSPCRMDSLVFAQCFLEPRWSVKTAVDTLFRKALTGKRLPDVPICGA